MSAAETEATTGNVAPSKSNPEVEALDRTSNRKEDQQAADASESVAIDPTEKAAEGSSGDKPVSKKQMKRQRKWERAMEVKKRRKQQDKEIKIAKAKAEGRDLEKERLEQERKTKDGAGRRKRQEWWDKEKLPKIKKSFQVCIDCSFGSLMTTKEIGSLASQIRYCYSHNRHNPHPCALTVTSLEGETLANMQNVAGFDDWTTRAFSSSDKSVAEVFQDRLQDVVYLTSDSENTIEHLDNSKIYVIGGIVDRNRLKRAAINRAEEWGLQTAKLPLAEHLTKMKTTKVLTCNHVFEILLKYRMFGNSWERALLEVLPSRKHKEPKSKSDGKTEEKNDEDEKDESKDEEAGTEDSAEKHEANSEETTLNL